MFSRACVIALVGSFVASACVSGADPSGDDSETGAPNGGGVVGNGGSSNQGGAAGTASGAMQGGTAGAGAFGGAAGVAAQSGTGPGGASGATSGGASGASAGGSGGGPPIVPGPPYAFPQGYRSSRCRYPTGAHHDVARAAYERWRNELVTSSGAGGFLRVRRPGAEGDTTVSEGIAYGMIFAVVMGDPTLFDGLWKYEQAHLNQNGLMNWKVDSAGVVPMDGVGAATDADEDMAWALLLADKKWGGAGSLGTPYLDLAKAQIEKIWNHEVDHGRGDLLLAGDSWGMTVTHNPSYFAPNQYRRFGQVTGNVAGWNRVIERNYALLAGTLQASLGNASNGLVPAWTDADGRPMAPFMGAPMHHQYDSARIPFRIAQDYCDFGEARAKTYLDKTTSFFAGVGVAQIVDGYALNGMPRAENPLPAQSALFVGAAGVGAMTSTAHGAFVDQVYQHFLTKELLPPSYYYNLSWQVFTLLMLTGNLYDYYLVP